MWTEIWTDPAPQLMLRIFAALTVLHTTSFVLGFIMNRIKAHIRANRAT
jgi:hypothetical protein